MSDTSPLLSTEQERALSAVLDEIVPPGADGRMPGAGELGIARHIARVMSEDAGLRSVVVQGLAALGELARALGFPSFDALPGPRRLGLLNQLESTAPAFLPSLIYNTFVGYYQHPRVSEALGIGADPPHPKGYTMPPNDLSLLEPVRRRGKIYREC